MARKVAVELLDDLDQSPASQTVSFGYQGRDYEIDLNDKNAARFEKLLSTYIEAGRRAGGRRRAAVQTSQSNGDAAKIRAWAIENGYEVSARGRVSAEIVAAYNAA